MSRGLPVLQEVPRGKRLAIVGGGPSLASHVAELQDWDGDIWAINGTWLWCRDHEIDATMFSIDPLPGLADVAKHCTNAILATCCDPAVFDAMRGEDVVIFDMRLDGTRNGPTSLSTAPIVGIMAGYSDFVLFGCDSSWDGNTHIYKDEEVPYKMVVRVGNCSFVTEPEFLLQAEFLAQMARECPAFVEIRSGGLVSALVANPEWQCTHLTPELNGLIVGGKNGC
jgi:hypothetical protein